MNVICTYCNATYNIPDHKIPAKRLSAPCKKCGGQIIIEPGIVPDAKPEARSRESMIEQHLDPNPATHSTALARQTILQDYPELQNLVADRFALEEILKPNKKGGYKTRDNKFKLKVIKATSELVDKILEDDEKVMRIGKGTALYPVEIFFGNGFLTMMYNHYAIVCTDRRLLLINIDSRIKRPTHYLFQMTYDEIKNVKRGLFGNGLIFDRKQGKRRTFQQVKRSVSKELMQFIMDRKDSTEGVSTETEPMENLCPACFVPLRKGLIQCPQCEARFKAPKKALLRSLLLPGLGDMYLGHRGLGLFELMGSSILWMAVILSLLPGEAQNLYGIVIILLFYNGIDGMLTHHMAKKGYMLAN